MRSIRASRAVHAGQTKCKASTDSIIQFLIYLVPFGVTYEKIGTIQRRLAWPLHKDDTLFRSGRPTGLNIYLFCFDCGDTLDKNLMRHGFCDPTTSSHFFYNYRMATRRKIGVSAASTETARRQLMQPVPCWKRILVTPEAVSPSSPLKAWKWVKTDEIQAWHLSRFVQKKRQLISVDIKSISVTMKEVSMILLLLCQTN